MIIATTIIFIVLIICASILFAIYMCFCSENEMGIFSDPEYRKRIRELEEEIKELKGE